MAYDAFDISNRSRAALHMQELLIPINGKDSPVCPPTYAAPKEDKDQKSGYSVDYTRDGNTCIIDNVGSQANRMEPIFMMKEYKDLIPQIIIKAPIKSEDGSATRTVNLCEVGHRVADAFIRNTAEFEKRIKPALLDLSRPDHDALKMAKLAPTSLVYGMWDSRGTNVKMPRIIASTIRAGDVEELTAAAQYTPPINYKDAGVFTSTNEQKKLSAWGFSSNPATGMPGGVIVHGAIRRDLVVNLSALRKITTENLEIEEMMQRYLLGLALVAATAPMEPYLREGCLLVRDAKQQPGWEAVNNDGTREKLTEMDHATVLKAARQMASEFGVGDSIELTFSKEKAQEEAKKAKRSKE